jgi:chromosome segregation ATPase
MEEENKKLLEQVATLTAQIATITGERDSFKKEAEESKSTITKLGDDITKKDQLIEAKNRDLVGARKTYKKLTEMTQEEKDQLTDAEKELKERQEVLENQQKDFENRQNDLRVKEVTARRDAIINKMAGGKPEFIEKIKANWAKLNTSIVEKASTEEELKVLVGDAYNMLGSIKPEAVREVIGASGAGEAGGEGRQDFTTTPEGQSLAGALGIDLSAPKK